MLWRAGKPARWGVAVSGAAVDLSALPGPERVATDIEREQLFAGIARGAEAALSGSKCAVSGGRGRRSAIVVFMFITKMIWVPQN